MKTTLEQLKDKLVKTTGQERLDLLILIIREMPNIPEIEVYVEEGIMLANQLGEQKKKASLLLNQGYFSSVFQKFELAKESYQRALEISQQIGDRSLYLKSLKGLGSNLLDTPEQSLAYSEKALEIAIKEGFIEEAVWLCNSIGNNYTQQMLFDKGIPYFMRGIELGKSIENKAPLGITYLNLANYSTRGIEYLKKTIAIFEEINEPEILIRAYGGISEIYKKDKEYAKSHEAINVALVLADKTNVCSHIELAYVRKVSLLLTQAIEDEYEDEMSNALLEDASIKCRKAIEGSIQTYSGIEYQRICYLYQAQIYYHQGNYESALEELLKIDKVLLEKKFLVNNFSLSICNKYLAKTYEALNDAQNALHYYKEYLKWNEKFQYSESVKQSKILEAQFETKNKQLEITRLQELEEMKTRFFSQITHEFRTPLSLIIGPINQLLQIETNQDKIQQAQIIQRNGNRLLQLVNQLLDINKLEAGKMKLRKSFGVFPVFVETIANAFQTTATQKQIQFDVINELGEFIANFDADKIEKIVYNLLSNAFKFTPFNGRVLCKLSGGITRSEKINIQISVVDNGQGIMEEALPHIFDRFYQADNTFTRSAEGTGIGLSLVKELVELMDGQIEVKSTLNIGTTFKVSLPLELGAKGDVEKIITKRTSIFLEPTNGNKKAIQNSPLFAKDNVPVLLLIEDNIDMHTYIRNILGDKYIILEAFNGKEGTQMAIDRVPDLILSDVMMPEKDGYQVCAELKEDHRTSHIPIVLLTAKAALKSRIEGLAKGADAYLSKPFSAEELKLQLQNLLQTQSNLQKKNRHLAFANKKPKALNKEEQFLVKVKKVVEENINDENLSVEKLSQLLFLSSSQLYRKIQALTNLSTSEFIREIRLEKAKNMLESKQWNVSEVAYQLGFTPSYFSKCFYKKYGYLPKTLLN